VRLRPLTATLVAAALAAAPAALAGGADDPLPALQQERTITETIKPSFHAVKINLDAGAITLRPSSSHVLKLHETYIRDEPVVTYGVKNGTLTITVHCARDLQTPVFFAQLLPCTTDLTLGVPSRLTVVASTGGGNVDIASVHGDLTVDSGGGDVTLAHVRSNKLDASTSSGALAVTDAIAASAELQSGGGNVQLTTAKIPAVSASSSSGNVALRGVVSRTITANSGGGDVLVAASSASTMRLSSSSGAVDVTGSTATSASPAPSPPRPRRARPPATSSAPTGGSTT
jgi:hypothetical protein